MSDLIERQAAIDALDNIQIPRNASWYPYYQQALTAVSKLPSVHPTYTDAEIQKMQDMEQAEIEKAFDLGREDAMAEIVRCKDCRWQKDQSGSTAWLPCRVLVTPDDFYCGRAERRTDEQV